MGGDQKPGLSYKARRRWSLMILVIGLPLYIVAVVTVVNLLNRPPIWVELLVYIVLGILWALPFKFVFPFPWQCRRQNETRRSFAYYSAGKGKEKICEELT